MPILKTSQAMHQLTSGQVLEVLATDAAAPPDFVAYARQTGHTLLLSEEHDGVYRFLVQHK